MYDTGEHTFLFADLAGFTALTEAHGDESAAEIVSGFHRDVGGLLAGHGAEQIKTIGDEVMARVSQANEAVALGQRIVSELAAHGAPPIRVGMHTGSAVERDGDWFGATVNIAARVAGAAKPGEVLLTEATKLALSSDSATDLRERGERWFKNVPHLVLVYAAHVEGHEIDMSIDPYAGWRWNPTRLLRTPVTAARSTTSAPRGAAKRSSPSPGATSPAPRAPVSHAGRF